MPPPAPINPQMKPIVTPQTSDWIIRLRGEQESDVFSYLSRIEQNINDNGFTTRRATEQDLKKMLGVYFEQNVTTEKFEDFDGDRWVIVGE